MSGAVPLRLPYALMARRRTPLPFKQNTLHKLTSVLDNLVRRGDMKAMIRLFFIFLRLFHCIPTIWVKHFLLHKTGPPHDPLNFNNRIKFGRMWWEGRIQNFNWKIWREETPWKTSYWWGIIQKYTLNKQGLRLQIGHICLSIRASRGLTNFTVPRQEVNRLMSWATISFSIRAVHRGLRSNLQYGFPYKYSRQY